MIREVKKKMSKLDKKNSQTSKAENRIYNLPIQEVRQMKNDDGDEYSQIEGYAVMYNKNSEIMYDYWGDAFVERFAAGAFRDSLAERKQKALWNHNWSMPLGSVKAGTLALMDQSDGLRYLIDIPNNSWGHDAAESIGRGDTDGTSFGFRALEDMWEITQIDGEDVYMRTVLRAELYEVSPCTMPAYPDSTSEARSIKCRDHVKNSDMEKRKRLSLAIETMIGGC
jgi:HK97 family phage prohead protease